MGRLQSNVIDPHGHTSFDTYGTAAPGFSEGILALGNDAGILKLRIKNHRMKKKVQKIAVLIQTIHYFAISACFFFYVVLFLCLTGLK